MLGAIVADAADARELAFLFLIAAIPAIAIAALAFFGELAEGSADTEAGAVYVGLSTLALVLVVIGTAVRANTLPDHAIPALGVSTLVGALTLLGMQLAVWTSLQVSRRRTPEAATASERA